MQQANGNSQHLPALDVLRGGAIVAVIWHHMYIHAFPSGWWTGGSVLGLLGSVLSNGWLGVNLFFILSGFVLYWPFANGRSAFNSGTDAVAFYKRRALRLLPLFYLSSVVITAVSAYPSMRSQIALFTLTFNFHRDTFFPAANFVLWSLGIEIWFSIVFPAVVLSVAKLGWRTTATWVFALAIGVRLGGILRPDLGFGNNPFLHPIKDSFLGRLDDLFVGMGLAAAYAKGFRFRRPWLAIGLGLSGCLATMLVIDAGVVGLLPKVIGVFNYTLFQLGAACLISGALSAPGFRMYPLELLGMMCYSIYVWHGVVMWHVSPPPIHTATNGIKYVLILGSLSWLSYRYIEFGHIKDAFKLLPRRSSGQAARSVPSATVGGSGQQHVKLDERG